MVQDICLFIAGTFAPGVDGKTGRYSVLGSLPAVPSFQLHPGSSTGPVVASLHAVMHDYHTHSEVSLVFLLSAFMLSGISLPQTAPPCHPTPPLRTLSACWLCRQVMRSHKWTCANNQSHAMMLD